MRLFFLRRVAVLLLGVVLILWAAPCSSQAGEPLADSGQAAVQESYWSRINTGSLNIYYQPGLNLKKVERHLRSRQFNLFGRDPALTDDVSQRIGSSLATLLSKVKEMLSMYPDMSDLAVKIFRTREELSRTYYEIFKMRQDYRSFYVHKLRTIYTSEEDISDSVMAHELAHAVMDHYFLVPPPPAVAELIASDVDRRLDD